MATNEELKDQLDLIENKIDSNDGYIKEVFDKNIELVSPIAQDVDLGNGVVLPNLKKLMDEIDDIVMQKMLEKDEAKCRDIEFFREIYLPLR